MPGEHMHGLETLNGLKRLQPVGGAHQPFVHHGLTKHRKAAGHYRIAGDHAAFLWEVNNQGVIAFRFAQVHEAQTLITEVEGVGLRDRCIGQIRRRAPIQNRGRPGRPVAWRYAWP